MNTRSKRTTILAVMVIALLSAVLVLPAAAVTTLNYSSYLGGSTSDMGYDIAVDNAGNSYITGKTDSTNFTTTPGAYQTTNAGGFDAFVAKFDSSGNLVYSTYLGGSGADSGLGIAVDSAGNIYITGQTVSNPFPTTPGAYQTTYGGGTNDAFVAKFDSSGNLVYSTYLGGSGNDFANGIAVDSAGNSYITGQTPNPFPITPGAYQTTYGGGTNDAFVAKFDSSGNLVYSTYLGGATADYGQGIAVDTAGNFYGTGRTQSTNFPTTPGAYQPTCGGNYDAFVAKFDSSGNLAYSTYLGGSTIEYGYDIAVDTAGNFYGTGRTQSTNFPTTPDAYQPACGGGYDAFVAKFDSSGNLAYSTYLGGAGSVPSVEYATNIAVDSTGNMYISGRTDATNFPTTPDAYKTTKPGVSDTDAFISTFDSSGNLAYSTFFGGASTDYGYGMAVDSTGNFCITGQTASNPFPTTPGAYQPTYGGGSFDAFFVRFTVVEAPTAAFTADVTSGTAPLTVSFTDLSTGAPTAWAWDFGDGNTSTAQNPVHIYQNTGTYTVTLTATNAYGSDSETKTNYITVSELPTAAFTADVLTGEVPLTVHFTDQSTGTAPLTYAWDFENDGTVDSTDQNPVYTYTTAGTYTVKLNVTNVAGSDDEVKTDYITVSEPPVAEFMASVPQGQIVNGNFETGGLEPWNASAVVPYGDLWGVQLVTTGSNKKGTTGIRLWRTPVNGSNTWIEQEVDLTNVDGIRFWWRHYGVYSSQEFQISVDGTIVATYNGTAPTNRYEYVDLSSHGFTGTHTLRFNAYNGYYSPSGTPTYGLYLDDIADYSPGTSGTVQLTVMFKDLSSSSPTSWAWDFDNNGVVDSTDQNPTYTYSTPGTYTVKLNVTNVAGSDEEMKTDYITVNEPTPPTAAFTADVLTGDAPLTVHFTDQSTGTAPLTYAWDFDNDGTVDSTGLNPVYTYTTPGTYTVKLNVTNVAGSDEEVKTGYITVGEEIYNGTVLLFDDTFTWYDSYSGDPHTVNWLTPHGALETASTDDGFDYGGSWKGSKNTALIDWIGNYTYSTTLAWNYQLNGVYQNYFSDVTGVSNNPVGDGDFIEFYFGPKYDQTTDNATAFVRLTVEEANAAVYFEPEDVRVPGYCNTTTVGVWVNTAVAMGSGKLTFNYTYCCLNVTDFAFNTTNFDPGVSGTLTTAILTPGQVVLNFATGAQEGVGPGPVHIGDATFHCCRDSGEYCETDLDWVPGYPDSYVEDTGAAEITPVLYDDGIFRCNIPDLVITSIVGTGNDTHYTVTYTIKNIGAASAPAGHSTCLSIDGSLVETKAVPDALAAGEEKEYAFDSVIARNTSNPYDLILVCADCEDAVIELDEANNCLDGRYPAEVVVTVIPELTLVQPQDQFDVKVHIDTKGQSILGVQYVLTYDTSVLRAETQTKGPFLGAIGDTIVVVNEIDQAHGIIEYAETRKGDTGVIGEGNVSTIHFIAIGERGDSSPLVLSEVIVVDVNKEETLLKLEDGQVNLTANMQPPIPIGSSKFLINNVAKKYPSTAILCSCSWDPDWPGKGGNITYIRWAFGDGQYGTSEGLPVENCTCKEHKYESWLWADGAYLPFDVLLTVTDDGSPELTNSTNFSVTVYIAGDANGDGEVNILDAVWVGKHWRDTCPATDYCESCEGYLWFDPEPESHWAQKDGADLNNDCEINILDAVVIGANWRHVAWE